MGVSSPTRASRSPPVPQEEATRTLGSVAWRHCEKITLFFISAAGGSSAYAADSVSGNPSTHQHSQLSHPCPGTAPQFPKCHHLSHHHPCAHLPGGKKNQKNQKSTSAKMLIHRLCKPAGVNAVSHDVRIPICPESPPPQAQTPSLLPSSCDFAMSSKTPQELRQQH